MDAERKKRFADQSALISEGKEAFADAKAMAMNMGIRRYIGDRKFYRMALSVAVPIMVQNGITNFVSLLDNIMVGRLGTEEMSGVSIVNQFIFIFNLLIFGAVSAAGIFTAQYHGSGDVEGERHTFRFKFLVSFFAAALGIVAFSVWDDPLISLFLHDGSTEGDLAKTLAVGKEYLAVMLIGLIPYALSQVYASTMRETGESVPPMIASISAVLTNFVLNNLLIFGLFGFPRLGVRGAAIATVASRFVEFAVLAVFGHTHPLRCPYLVGVFRSFRLPRKLAGQIALKGLPLMLNEFFWAMATTMRNQCYSMRGLDVVAAENIAVTMFNLFAVIYYSFGTTIAIIIGNLLGAGKAEEAKDTDRKLLVFSVACSILMGLLLAGLSPVIPMIYNTTDEVRALATKMMMIDALFMPFYAFANSAYYTIRSGGHVMITLLFDSVFMWTVVMPTAFTLAYFTELGILWLFAICQGTEILKVIFGSILLHRGTWANRIVHTDEAK